MFVGEFLSSQLHVGIEIYIIIACTSDKVLHGVGKKLVVACEMSRDIMYFWKVLIWH